MSTVHRVACEMEILDEIIVISQSFCYKCITENKPSASTTIVKGSSKSHMVDADWSDKFPSPN